MFDFANIVILVYETPSSFRVFDCPSEESAEEQAYHLIQEDFPHVVVDNLDEALHTPDIEARVRVFTRTIVERVVELQNRYEADTCLFN